MEELRNSGTVSIPRSYHKGFNGEVYSYTLCGFCDASRTAYAAVIYLLMKTQTRMYTQFLVAKTRVAPVRMLTIPRLELLSALLLSRLIITVSSALESTLPDLDMKCYTDSTVALYWTKGETKEWKPFVENCVNEICKRTPPDLWNHCSGTTNPADLPSRGMTMTEWQVSCLWQYGPDWLRDTPVLNVDNPTEMPEECSMELKARNKKTHNLTAIEVKHTIGDLINCEEFSSYRRLVRVTAYVVRAVEIFKSKRSYQNSGPLSPKELADAEQRWIEDSQGDLNNENSFDSLRYQLNLFLDEDGLWRCGGRLANAEIFRTPQNTLSYCLEITP